MARLDKAGSQIKRDVAGSGGVEQEELGLERGTICEARGAGAGRHATEKCPRTRLERGTIRVDQVAIDVRATLGIGQHREGFASRHDRSIPGPGEGYRLPDDRSC